MRRILILAMLASLLVACSVASAQTPSSDPATAPKPAASPSASPKVSPSPSPAAGGAASGGGGLWATIRTALTSDTTLVIIGIVLTGAVAFAWYMSNRAEATPNEDQLSEISRFVTDHFAKYVARGLAAEGVGAVAVSKDSAWRKVYLQHLRLHNELYAFRKDIALQVYEAKIDAAVQHEIEAARAAGQHANPAVAGGDI